MRLLTHNMLVCNVKACVDTASRAGTGAAPNYPLKIDLSEGALEMVPSDFEPARVLHLLPKLDWAALRKTASELGIAELPPAPPAEPEKDAAFLKSVHDLVLDLHINEGALVCGHCGRRYPIRKGVPHMLLKEDEL